VTGVVILKRLIEMQNQPIRSPIVEGELLGQGSAARQQWVKPNVLPRRQQFCGPAKDLSVVVHWSIDAYSGTWKRSPNDDVVLGTHELFLIGGIPVEIPRSLSS
jgi:hypothetical protein